MAYVKKALFRIPKQSSFIRGNNFTAMGTNQNINRYTTKAVLVSKALYFVLSSTPKERRP